MSILSYEKKNTRLKPIKNMQYQSITYSVNISIVNFIEY